MKSGYKVENYFENNDKFIEVCNYHNSNKVINLRCSFDIYLTNRDYSTVGVWKIKKIIT